MGPSRHGFDPRRVLVIEDEGIIASLTVEMLTDESFEARSAGDGCSALTLLQSWTPCLILLDT